MQVGILCSFNCRVIFAPQLHSPPCSVSCFFANCASACHNENIIAELIEFFKCCDILKFMEIIFLIVILIFSIVLHEVSHGVVANALGDPTAKLAGRLTLNPIPHLDLMGSIILPLILVILPGNFIIGWAKPVPVNPFNLRGKYASALVGLAGPGSNLAIALVFGLALRFLPIFEFNQALFFILGFIVYLNILLAVFNLIPIPPLDGSHILFTFLPRSYDHIKIFLARYGIFLMLFLIFFFFSFILFVVNLIFEPLTSISLFQFLRAFSIYFSG